MMEWGGGGGYDGSGCLMEGGYDLTGGMMEGGGGGV